MNASRRFRFGVINERMTTAGAWIDAARRTEAQGYATFLIRDHFVPDHFGDQFAPFSALTAAACATTTLRVGCLVIDNDYRHPVVLAKEAATLDLLSGGRFELGLGAGFMKTEYDKAGIAFDAPGIRVSRLAEAIDVLKGLFGAAPPDPHRRRKQADADARGTAREHGRTARPTRSRRSSRVSATARARGSPSSSSAPRWSSR